MHVSRAKRKGCQLCNNYNNSVITRPIALKLRMHVGTHPAMYPCVTVVVRLHVCTCKTTIFADIENGGTDPDNQKAHMEF